MSSNQQIDKYSPGILSVLPILYVGWSDSVLSPSEMKMIQKKISDMDFLATNEIEVLKSWTNPGTPPNRSTFKNWLNIIREGSKNLTEAQKVDLVSVGMGIAHHAVQFNKTDIWESEHTRASITELASALGVQGTESFNLLIGKIQPKVLNQDIAEKASFDVSKMVEFLDGEYGETRGKIRKLLRDPFFKYEPIRDKDAYRQKILDQCLVMAKYGFGAFALPKEYGGQEKTGDHIVVFEMISYGDISLTIKFGVHFGLFGGAVFLLGTKKHHDKYLKGIASMAIPGCFAMTETNHGSNVQGLETTAIYDHETKSITIHTPHEKASKEYIGNGIHGKMSAVFAQLIVDGEHHGVHSILVPLRDENQNTLPGIRVEDCGYKMGLNGVDNVRIWFDQVKVPVENLLDKYGGINDEGKYVSSIKKPSKRFFTMLGALVVGRICIGLAGIAASKSALSIAIRYGLKRRQFGSGSDGPENIIMDYPMHQRRLLPLLAKTYAINIALYYVQEKYVSMQTDLDTRKVETLAAGMKAYATWHTTATIQECREACGGKGYLWENRFTDLKADTDIFTTFEGDNNVLMQLVSKGLLSQFNQSFHDGGYRAVARFLGSRFTTTMAELNPYVIRNVNVEHLLDQEFHQNAFKYREKKLLISVGQRMRNYIKKRITPYQAYLKCSAHMNVLAEAYIERKILDIYYSKINEVSDKALKNVLIKLAQLFALHTIEKHKGWYLENDYMTGSKTKAVRRVINKLCQEIRPESLALVESFAIPKEVLGAEII